MDKRYFTEEHQLFRESLQDFLKKEVVPHIDKWEKTGAVERFIWKKFGDMGYFGLATPEEYGGLDLDLFYTVIFLEEMQKINSSGFAANMWAHAYLAMTHLNKEGNHDIKKKYLDRILDNGKVWEMRSSKTKITGRIGLIESGSGLIVAKKPMWV